MPDAVRPLAPARRIGFDAIRAVRNATGLGNYSRDILRALHRVYPRLDLRLYSPLPPRAKYGDVPGELNADLQLPPYDTTNPISRALWRTFRLGRVAARDRVELYHGLTHEIPRDLPATGIPSVLTVHDLIFEKHPQYFPFFDRASYRWRYRWSAQHADAIVAVSEQTRSDLVTIYHVDPARITVLPPARNPVFMVPVPAAERTGIRARYGIPDRFVLSVGTLEPRKNQALLIDALSQLDPAIVPMLVLVGRDGGSLVDLKRLIARLDLGARVRIVHDVTTAHLPALMQSATLFLYPSLAEGFGMPVAEALSAGTPVIAAREGGLSDAGGPDTRYAAAEDATAWAAAMLELSENAEARDRMSAAGQLFAMRFDGERVAARLMAVYDAVLSGGTPPAHRPPAEAVMERAH